VRAPVGGPGSTTDPAEARYRFARPFLPVVCFDVPRLAAALFTVVLLDVAVRGLTFATATATILAEPPLGLNTDSCPSLHRARWRIGTSQ